MNLFLSSRASTARRAPATLANAPKRVLWVACAAHALHDGYTDMIYALLPVWQQEFGLGYGALAMLRGFYAAAMATFQLPAGFIAQKLGSRAVLTLGTLLAALGYGFAGLSGSLAGLCIALALSGTGSSAQHPLASGAVSRAFRAKARGPLGIYNFSGDLGKSALPAAISLLVTVMSWRHAVWIMSALGCGVALFIALFLPHVPRRQSAAGSALPQVSHKGGGGGFSSLFAIGVLDTAVRMGLLTFLPFLLRAKGISPSMLGTALALVFIGGAAGKFACGWVGARVGVVTTVLITEGATAACILAVLYSPLAISLVLLPLLGMMLNGTSSVLYGTVPELVPLDRTERAFALFYTGTVASGAISPIIYGVLGDHVGIRIATILTALTALAIFPLAIALRSRLRG